MGVDDLEDSDEESRGEDSVTAPTLTGQELAATGASDISSISRAFDCEVLNEDSSDEDPHSQPCPNISSKGNEENADHNNEKSADLIQEDASDQVQNVGSPSEDVSYGET